MILCSIVLLSASVAFATGDDVAIVEAGDEITSDDVLSVEDDNVALNEDENVLGVSENSDVVCESSTVTNDTFFNYFEADGTLKSDVTSDELIFEGEFSNIPNVNYIFINKTIKLTGKNAIINNISLVIDNANEVTIDSFTINTDTASNAIFVSSSKDVKIANNNITFNAIDDDSACAIYADAANALKLQSNRVTVVGNKQGNKVVSFVDCVGAVVDDNVFVGVIPSSGYQTGALHFDYGTSDLVFSNNIVDVTGTEQSTYSTTCAVVFAGNNVTFDNNAVYCINDTYSYGVVVLGSDSVISNSYIGVSSPTYACGINLEGYSWTVVDDNEIVVSSEGSAYGIYSGMTSGGLIGNYTNNNISADAYFAVGVELGSPEEYVIGNAINVSGNYTVGIAAIPSVAYVPPTWEPAPIPIANRLVKGNNITLSASNKGDRASGDSYISILTSGIYTVIGNMTIVDNFINSNGVGVYAEAADNLVLNLNHVIVNGNKVVYFVDCVGAVVDDNVFVGVIPSSGYQTGALHFDYGTSDLVFSNNIVDVTGTEQSIYSTTCAVVFAGNNVTFDNNAVFCINDTYSYGVVVLGSDSVISNSYIGVSSPTYACGINLEGYSWTVVDDNEVVVSSEGSAYGIYSGMTSGGLIGNYTDNIIRANAYFAVGVELGSPDESVVGNVIWVSGNYTVGVAAIPSIVYVPPTWEPAPIPIANRLVKDNNITLNASNVGNISTGDSYIPAVTAGVYTVIGNMTITHNMIYSNDVGIYAESADNLVLNLNRIGVVGSKVVSFVDCVGSVVDGNAFLGVIPSSGYQKGALNFDYGTSDLVFTNNFVYVLATDQGKYDTTCGVVFAGNNVTFEKNNVSCSNCTYSYGVVVLGSNSTISGCVIGVSSPTYACGINLEGSGWTVVDNNGIGVYSEGSVYGIYSGMTSGGLIGNYTNNIISVDAYFAVGVELGSPEEYVIGNIIDVSGNYTVGVAAIPSVAYDPVTWAPTPIPIANRLVKDNNITSKGTNVGNTSSGDSYIPAVTTGVYAAIGNITIENNTILTNGDYAVDLTGKNAVVENNYLAAKKGVGTGATVNAGNAVVSGNTPSLKTILSAVDLYTVYASGDVYFVTLADENGDAVVNATIELSSNNKILNEKTNEKGVAMFFVDDWDVGQYNVNITYYGDKTYGPKSKEGLIIIEQRESAIAGVSDKTVLLTAVKTGSYVTITLKDNFGSVLAGENVTITFNGKTNTYTTSLTGVIKYKLTATKTGSKTLKVVFNSNANYVPATKTATIKLTKEATKLTAKAKTFKAKTKTKKYVITLKDSKGKALKKVKVTIKVKGKTYKATTNSKGKATFKITKLTKKGKYTATVKFAGNNYYKAVKKSVKITVKK